MIIRYSARATRDLESIYEYLSQRSPRGALHVLTAIYAAVEFVRRDPEAAEATTIDGIRMKVVHRYRFKIFYRAIRSEDAVEVVHVRHTSRRPWAGGDN
jgi:plasmid stabilization system protein ParE